MPVFDPDTTEAAEERAAIMAESGLSPTESAWKAERSTAISEIARLKALIQRLEGENKALRDLVLDLKLGQQGQQLGAIAGRGARPS